MKVDYIKLAQEYHGKRSDGYLTDVPMPVELNSDAIVINTEYLRIKVERSYREPMFLRCWKSALTAT